MIQRVLIPKKAYKVITGIVLLRVGKGVALLPLKENWHALVNMVMPQINIESCNILLPVINSIDDQWRCVKVSGTVLTTP